VLIGESGPSLADLFRKSGVARVEQAASLQEAVDLADAIAREALAARAARPAQAGAGGQAAPGPATVLLSPAAASFDMFADYVARGAAFRAAVEAIARRRAAGEPSR